MILYLSLYFGRWPSPAQRGIISSLLLQPVASYGPSRPSELGHEGFVVYEYVGDGAFAESWIDTHPWTSVKIRGRGLQSRLCTKAMRVKKRQVEGDFATSIIL